MKKTEFKEHLFDLLSADVESWKTSWQTSKAVNRMISFPIDMTDGNPEKSNLRSKFRILKMRFLNWIWKYEVRLCRTLIMLMPVVMMLEKNDRKKTTLEKAPAGKTGRLSLRGMQQ